VVFSGTGKGTLTVSNPDNLDFETLAARAGAHRSVAGARATASALSPSTTYTYDSISAVHAALAPEPEGFAYSRNANPTVAAFEEVLAELEGAEEVVAFGSGMAAIHAVFVGLGLEAGDSVTVASDLYGATRSLLNILAAFEVSAHYVDILDAETLERALSETRSRLLFIESLSNPLLRVPDVPALVETAHRARALVAVDNTFATPFLFRPIEHGADVVVHSATKYIAGHGDAMAGIVAGSRGSASRVRAIRTSTGGVLSPFDAWLAIRGVKTLPVRFSRQCESALAVASWLEDRPWVERVYYPGLATHPQHSRASQLFRGRFGGVVAFDLRANKEDTLSFLDALSVIGTGTTLGDVVSLALYPPLASHRFLDPEQQRKAGIGESLVRLSVGLESVEDLKSDLKRAAQRVGILEPGAVGSSRP
jgi:cystathionine beta-lyase/cystathionine gamma-synthase